MKTVLLILPVLLHAGYASAQIPQTVLPPEGTPANRLPLSGRTGQTGAVTAGQSPVAGTTNSINTINPTVRVQGGFTGSAEGPPSPTGRLSLRDAIQRGLQYNLGPVGQREAVRLARGERTTIRSVLLPHVNAMLSETVEQINLRAFGFGLGFIFPIPGVSVPTIVGPFNFFDLRASLSQIVFDRTAMHNYRSSTETLRANEMWAEDARDLVVLAVGGAYLQAVAAQARAEAARAQVETAEALYDQASQQRRVGLVAQTDVNRAQIQALTQRQRLLSLENDLAKQKINVARMTGLPPGDAYELTDNIPFLPGPPITLEDALRLAFEQRSDLRAAQAQVRAADKALAAARAERIPSVSVRGDYGVIGTTPGQSHGTFSVVGNLRVPIWQGGRTEGNIQQAEAVLGQRQAEVEDIAGQIDSDVRNAWLDIQAAASQVEVALKNTQVTQENLVLTRQRFDAGVSDNVEVVQAQESVATAQLDYINSVFAHNLAKIALARAVGNAADRLTQFLRIP